MIKCKIVWRAHHCLKVEPLSRQGIVLCSWNCFWINLDHEDNADHVIARIAARLSSHGEKYGIRALDVALFLELAYASHKRIFVVVDMAAGERKFVVESRLLAPDHQNIITIVFSLRGAEHNGICCCAWKLRLTVFVRTICPTFVTTHLLVRYVNQL